MTSSTKQQMMEDVLEGRPASSFETIDCHTHMGYWYNFNVPAHTAADMVHLMDRAGVRAIVSGAHAGIGPDVRLGNDEALAGMREFPGRIYGYCCVNPHYGAQQMRDELQRCFDSGMVAIKMHPAIHRHQADGEGYRPAWEFADEHSCCVLSHTDIGSGHCRLDLFDGLAASYPNAKILLGHSGFAYEGGKQAIELARKYPNVYLDITSSSFYTGLVERLVAGAGAERVLFGTDLPFFDCRAQIGRMAFTGLTDDELRLVLGANARALFGI